MKSSHGGAKQLNGWTCPKREYSSGEFRGELTTHAIKGGPGECQDSFKGVRIVSREFRGVPRECQRSFGESRECGVDGSIY